MNMYGQTDTNAYASSNGYVSILEGSSQYQVEPLPDSHIPANTLAAFFDDLYLYGVSSPQQGVWYQFNAAQTAVTVEYYVARAGAMDEIYHFLVSYDSAASGIFQIAYLAVGNGNDGATAVVGAQGSKSRHPFHAISVSVTGWKKRRPPMMLTILRSELGRNGASRHILLRAAPDRAWIESDLQHADQQLHS